MHSYRVPALVLLVAPFVHAAVNQRIDPNLHLEAVGGFCPGGASLPLTPSSGDPATLKVFGTVCGPDSQASPLATTSPFRAPNMLRIYTIGLAKSPMFSLERAFDGMRFHLVPFNEDPHHWSRSEYALPPDWQGKQVRIVAEGTAPNGLWRAFSEPLAFNGEVSSGDALNILGRTLLHYCALLLCALAMTAVAVWRGVRDRIQAGLILLAGTGVPGYILFWLALWKPRISHSFCAISLAASLCGLIWALRQMDREGRAVLRYFTIPLLLTGAAGLMVLGSGFLYGGMNDPASKAQCRFLPRLPPDNEIPWLLTNGVRDGHVPIPLQGPWLSSDRPPLESGMVLAQFPLLRKPREQGYTVLCVLAQSLWIFGLWLLLSAFQVNSKAMAVTIATCLFSGFAFLNMFFVWPKMLAAAYGLGFLAAFVARPVSEGPRFLSWMMPGILLGFGFLSHGGTAFALTPAIPLLLAWRGAWPIRRMAAVCLFGLICYAPWMAYQRFYDPPGNQLMKMHLAGVDGWDKRSFGEALKTAYGTISLAEAIANKKQNFNFAFGEGFLSLQKRVLLMTGMMKPDSLRESAARGLNLREQMFFHPAACLGPLIFAPFALLAGLAKRFRTSEWRSACGLWIFVLVAGSFWCVLMFGPSSTSIHQGAYVTMICAMAAGVLGLWALSPLLAVAVTVFEIGVNFVLNMQLIRVAYPNGLMPEGLMHVDTLVLLCVSTAIVFWLLWKLANLESESPAQQS